MQMSRGRKELNTEEDLGGDAMLRGGEGHFRLSEGYQGGHGTTVQHEMMTLPITTSSHVPSTCTVPHTPS